MQCYSRPHHDKAISKLTTLPNTNVITVNSTPFFDTYSSDHRIVFEIEPRLVGEEKATPVHTREPQMTSDQSYTLGSLEFQEKSGDSLVVSGKISGDL